MRCEAVCGPVAGGSAGCAVVALGGAPTGALWVDLMIGTAVGMFAGWTLAALPWRAVATLAAIAALWADPSTFTIVIVALQVAIVGSTSSRPVDDDERLRPAILIALTLVLFGQGRTVGPQGVGAAVIISLLMAASLVGVRRQSLAVQRRVRLGLAVVGGVGLLAIGAFAATGFVARGDLETGNDAARRGIAALEQAEFEVALGHFAVAAEALDRADARLGSVWTLPAQLVPIAAQHRRAATELASSVASAARSLEVELDAIDLDAVRIADGRIDIDAIRSLGAPLAAVEVSLSDLERAVSEANDPWLVRPIRDRLDRLAGDLAEYGEFADWARVAVELAPEMLGEDDPRAYLVMFTTPAEARGGGGFMGNFAEVTVDDGRISLTRFGRHDDLTRAAGGDLVLNDPPEDWLAIYGPQGFATGIDGPVRDAWMIIGLSPHFPSTAAVAADLYPQSGGQVVDGVVAFDVFALERLVGLVGPIEIGERRLTGRNTAEYLLVDQYRIGPELTNRDRIDALETIAFEVVDRLLNTDPPNPFELGRALAPMGRERRLTVWMDDPAEQDLASTVGIDGGLLSALDGRNGLSVVVVDDGASKMSTYLEREMTVSRTEAGDLVSVTVRHRAPVEQLSRLAVGRTSGVPSGWMRLSITLASDRPISNVRRDGEQIGFRNAPEAGVSTAGVTIELAPDESVTLEFQVAGAPSADGLVIVPQPLVVPERWSVDGGPPFFVSERSVLRRQVLR